MKFTLLLYGDETKWMNMSPEDIAQSVEVWNAFGQQLIDAGALVAGEALGPTPEATTVRIKEGEIVRTDGPFAETREQLGGFYVLECKDMDEAAAWAAKVPDLGESGSVEVRPVVDWTAAGAEQFGAEEARQA
jgi:hypothetical protein